MTQADRDRLVALEKAASGAITQRQAAEEPLKDARTGSNSRVRAFPLSQGSGWLLQASWKNCLPASRKASPWRGRPRGTMRSCRLRCSAYLRAGPLQTSAHASSTTIQIPGAALRREAAIKKTCGSGFPACTSSAAVDARNHFRK